VIYGLTGLFAAGKGTVALMIADEAGAPVFVLSDALRCSMRAQGIPITRESLQAFITRLREEEGNAVLAKRLAPNLPGNAVVDGIRSPDEVREFRKVFGTKFKLVSVEAPLEMRFERAKVRAREGEALTLEQFKGSEEREAAGKSFGILDCMRVADCVILNNGSREELCERVRSILD
jgi:dephospho-CoA kinase